MHEQTGFWTRARALCQGWTRTKVHTQLLLPCQRFGRCGLVVVTKRSSSSANNGSSGFADKIPPPVYVQ